MLMTMTEIGHRSSTSCMHEYLDTVLHWTQESDMKIIISKTKELLVDRWGRCDIAPLHIVWGIIEGVSEIKLFKVYIDSSLSWNKHINYIVGKAGKRFYCLKVLKRPGEPRDHLSHYYTVSRKKVNPLKILQQQV